jgi:hypothetical protein
MKGKTSEHSAESSARCLITKMLQHPQHWGLSYGRNVLQVRMGLRVLGYFGGVREPNVLWYALVCCLLQ